MRVILADDSALFRDGVSRMLTDRGIEVVAAVGDSGQLLAAVAREAPNVAITDIRMPPSQTTEGLEAARTIRAEHPEVAVMLLSQAVETHHALDLLSESTGHVGYLLKDRVADLDEFATTLERLAAGEAVIDPQVVATLLGHRRAHDPLDQLTAREIEILELMAEGRSNRGICDRLVLSPRTIESHVRSIFLKLDLPASDDNHRRVLAVLKFLRH